MTKKEKQRLLRMDELLFQLHGLILDACFSELEIPAKKFKRELAQLNNHAKHIK
jgi:hypothetical protein